MRLWTVIVSETRNYTCLYTIEARSKVEAEEKALDGNTIREKTLRLEGVIHRTVLTPPEKE